MGWWWEIAGEGRQFRQVEDLVRGHAKASGNGTVASHDRCANPGTRDLGDRLAEYAVPGHQHDVREPVNDVLVMQDIK